MIIATQKESSRWSRKGGMVIIVIGRICRICRICRACRVAKGMQVETMELNVEI